MRPPTRFRLRTLLIAVALVGLGFGATFEVRNRLERDRLLRAESDAYEKASWHYRQWMACKLSDAKPYNPAERQKVVGSRGTPIAFGAIRDWSTEADNHHYWGNRLHDQADETRSRRRALETRLLLP